MKHRLLYIPILLLFLLSFVDCAKRGTPSGGKKDSIPPTILKSIPENFSTNFTGNEISIYFDEYIKLKELNKQLIVSPPLKYTPTITPLSTSKIIKIKILDTLKENTTYSFNFGKSIVDNNEENAFEHFKYVFSTGNYIDSLSISGKVTDAQLLKPENSIAVLLYEVNEAFNDSLIFSEKPTYISIANDSINTYELANLKEGTYLLLALKEKNNDYTFQPKNDKIGFVKEYITLPTDSTYTLSLFKETPKYKAARPKHEGKNHIVFGYEGDAKDISATILTETPANFKTTTYKDIKKDTLHYWFKPTLEKDSLLFTIKNNHLLDTVNVKMKNLFADSLRIIALNAGFLTPKDTLKITGNTPLTSVDAEKIQVINKDSVAVEITANIDSKYNTVSLIFPKTEEQAYAIKLLPGAITDFFDKQNDTLGFRVRTKTVSDYGTLNLTLNNVKEYPVIVQLVNDSFKVVSEIYCNQNKPIFFDYITPGEYYIRIVYDKNKNGVWDTGAFLTRTQPETIIYYPSKLEVRANWSLNETFTLD